MLLIDQLVWIVTLGKEEKPNIYTYRTKNQSTSGGHYHHIIFFRFCYKTKKYQANCLFCIIQSSTPNTVFFHIFLNARYNGVFSIGSLINMVHPDTIQDYNNGVPIIVSNKQSILMLPMNNSRINIRNNLEAN